MNEKLRNKRMLEYVVINSHNGSLLSKEEYESKVIDWIEEILNKYSNSTDIYS